VWESALTFTGVLFFEVDGRPATVPTTAWQALGLRPTASPLLSVRRDGVAFVCHFLDEREVELDFAPSDIDGPQRFDSLVALLRGLASATGREVLVTPENQSDRPFLRYDPRTEQLSFIGVAG